MVSDDGIRRIRRPLGRVLEVYRGSDNLVRTADIETLEEIVQNNVRKLCIIDGTCEYSHGGQCGSLKA